MPFPFAIDTGFYSEQRIFFLMPGPTDMRKSLHALLYEVRRLSNLDPFSGNYFIFINKKKTIVKIIFWNINGLCMFQKNIESKRFSLISRYDKYIRLKHKVALALLS